MFLTLIDSLNKSDTLAKFLDERLEAYSLDKHFVGLFLKENHELLGQAWSIYNSRDIKKAVKTQVIEDTYNYLCAEVNCLEDTHFEIVGILSLEARRQLFETYTDYMLEKPESTRLVIEYAEEHDVS